MVAVLVGRTGMMLYVNTPGAVHPVGRGVPVHCVMVTLGFGSVTEIATEHGCPFRQPAGERSPAFRRRRAPVEQGLVLVQVVVVEEELELEEAGTGNKILICPEAEPFVTEPPLE